VDKQKNIQDDYGHNKLALSLRKSMAGLGTYLARMFCRFRWGVCDFGLNNRLHLKFNRLSKTRIHIFGHSNRFRFHESSALRQTQVVVLGSDNDIVIEQNAVVADSQIWIHGSHCTVHLGERVSINETKIILTDDGSSVSVGGGTMLGPGTEVRCGDGHAIFDLESRKILNRATGIEIGDSVLIGAGALILKNVKIGHGAIVGARSVVTKDVPENALVAGVPAKVVRLGVGWTRERVDDLPDGTV
jgi:acetyltransferase-like isoleucine patch superfamily enzyme